MLQRPGQSVKVKWRPLLVLVSVVTIAFVLVSHLTSEHEGHHDRRHQHDGPVALQSERERRGEQPARELGFNADLDEVQAQAPPPPNAANMVDLAPGAVDQTVESVRAKIADTQNSLTQARRSLAKLRGDRIAVEAEIQRLDEQIERQRVQNKLQASKEEKRRQDRDRGEIVLQGGDQPDTAIDRDRRSQSIRDEKLMAGIEGKSEKQRVAEAHARFAFNEYRSSQLSLHRDVPDARPMQCKDVAYPPDLPAATVIICFVNEAWSALFRTVWSVLDRTPENLLHEIILLDDASDASWLQQPLEEELQRLPAKVKLVRSPRRLGLIRARLLGAKHATADYMIFLDSHCEANVGWIQPLLAWMAGDPSRVVTPVIDSINNNDMSYHGAGGASSRGTFHWTLDFSWEANPEPVAQVTDPVKSPTMAGGLFGINRQYFYDVGSYDQGMDGWGGENLEMSFRVWQCGGSLHILPCSHVGHIFRDSHPYTIPNSTINDTFLRNSIRLAETWMDDYKEIFYQIRPSARKVDHGDVGERLALREKLQCKSFSWYLENIQPNKLIPSADFVLARGQVKNSLNVCLDKGAASLVYPCHPASVLSISQSFWFTAKQEIRYVWDTCLTVYGERIGMGSCGHTGAVGWELDAEHKKIRRKGQCLTAHNHNKLSLATCTDGPAQEFQFTGHMNG